MNRKQASEPDTERMLELSEKEFKKTMINMLGVLMDKVDSKQEETDNVSIEMEILRMNRRETLEVKTTVTEMKNTFREFNS